MILLSGLVIVLLLCYCNCNEYSINWIENIVSYPQNLFEVKASYIYNYLTNNNEQSISIDKYIKTIQSNSYDVEMTLEYINPVNTCINNNSECNNNENLKFPLDKYIHILRVSYASLDEMNILWNNPLQIKSISIANEIKAINVAIERLQYFKSNLKDFADTSDSTIENELTDYLSDLKFILLIIRDILSNFCILNVIESNPLTINYLSLSNVLIAYHDSICSSMNNYCKNINQYITDKYTSRLTIYLDSYYTNSISSLLQQQIDSSLAQCYIQADKFLLDRSYVYLSTNPPMKLSDYVSINNDSHFYRYLPSYVFAGTTDTWHTTYSGYSSSIYHTIAVNTLDGSIYIRNASSLLPIYLSYHPVEKIKCDEFRQLENVQTNYSSNCTIYLVVNLLKYVDISIHPSNYEIMHMYCFPDIYFDRSVDNWLDDLSYQQGGGGYSSIYISNNINSTFINKLDSYIQSIESNEYLSDRFMDLIQLPDFVDIIYSRVHNYLELFVSNVIPLALSYNYIDIYKKVDSLLLDPYISSNCSCFVTKSCERMLLVGLGGGTLQKLIVRHFPCVYIDTIEIDRQVVISAHRSFGMKDVICNYMTLNGYIDDVNNKSNSYIDSYSTNRMNEDRECRSRVIICDAFEFINQLSDFINYLPSLISTRLSTIGEDSLISSISTNLSIHLSYDIIFMDAFDHKTILWDGDRGKGESNIFYKLDVNLSVHRILFHLSEITMMRDGVVCFHLHHDSLMLSFISNVQMFLNQSSDIIVVKGDSSMIVFRSLTGRSKEINQLVQSNEEISTTSWWSYYSNSNNFLICENPASFYEHSRLLGETVAFHQSIRCGHMFSIVCADEFLSYFHNNYLD